jgi:hypothetical protein
MTNDLILHSDDVPFLKYGNVEQRIFSARFRGKDVKVTGFTSESKPTEMWMGNTVYILLPEMTSIVTKSGDTSMICGEVSRKFIQGCFGGNWVDNIPVKAKWIEKAFNIHVSEDDEDVKAFADGAILIVPSEKIITEKMIDLTVESIEKSDEIRARIWNRSIEWYKNELISSGDEASHNDAWQPYIDAYDAAKDFLIDRMTTQDDERVIEGITICEDEE